MSGVPAKRPASPIPRPESSQSKYPKLEPSSSSSVSDTDPPEIPQCYRVILETPPLSRKTVEIQLDDLWRQFGIEYDIVSSSPTIENMPLLLNPVNDHPWIKYWPTPGITSSMSSYVIDESSVTSSSKVPSVVVQNPQSQVKAAVHSASIVSSSITVSSEDVPSGRAPSV